MTDGVAVGDGSRGSAVTLSEMVRKSSVMLHNCALISLMSFSLSATLRRLTGARGGGPEERSAPGSSALSSGMLGGVGDESTTEEATDDRDG